MEDGESARVYLAKALKLAGVPLNEASLAVGKNATYIQQYITRGSPRVLPEAARLELVRRYQIDGDRLKPPAVSRRPSAEESRQVDGGKPPKRGKIVKDPEQLRLLRIWDDIPTESRPLAFKVLENFRAGVTKAA